MRPYIHRIHELENDAPGEYITTIKGKIHFKRWVMRRYFEEAESLVCFHLESEEIYYKFLPFANLKGKGKGGVVFPRMEQEIQAASDDIPF